MTPRELEVLQLLAEGLPNKAIAHRLGISEHTIKFHVNAIFGKLGAQSRTEAMVRATRLGLPDGQTVSATLVGRDPTTDLAVLQAQAANLTPPTWAEPDDSQVGHMVLALGRPGQTVQATLGIISAQSETSWRAPSGGRLDRYLQTDVVMYPGFSGGPLVNAAGHVVGLNTSALLRGVSLTVPAATLRRVVETLLTHGRIRRGYLGVSTQPVRLPDALAQQLGQETGLLLASVEPGSPADRGGAAAGRHHRFSGRHAYPPSR